MQTNQKDPPQAGARIDSKVSFLLVQGFAQVLYVASAIFVVWAVAIAFFPADAMPPLFASIVAIATALFFVAREARRRGIVEAWMRWVPSLIVMPVFAFSVLRNHTYALTTITVVLALHALFLPKVASRWMMGLTLAFAMLPLVTSDSLDLNLWVRLIVAALLGIVLFDFAARRFLLLARWLEESQANLAEQNHELLIAKAENERHNARLEELVLERTTELQSSNTALGVAMSELEGMNRQLEQLVGNRTAELQLANQKLSDAVRQLERLADTDGLTGLYCRRRFMELANSEVLRSIRYGTALSLVMLDVDHFKSINDRFGHHAGDVALTALAAFLDGSKRANDIIGRLGGEEFAILLPETPLDDAKRVAERVLAGVAAIRLNDSGNSFGMTASLGVVQLEHEGLDGLLGRADSLMYQAKASGRNRIASG